MSHIRSVSRDGHSNLNSKDHNVFAGFNLRHDAMINNYNKLNPSVGGLF